MTKVLFLLFMCNVLVVFGQVEEQAVPESILQRAKFLYEMEHSGYYAKAFLDSMPYGKQGDDYVTYYENGKYSTIFWKKEKDANDVEHLVVNFVVITDLPYSMRNCFIVESDAFPSQKDLRYIRCYDRLQTSLYADDRFKPYYQYGVNIIPIWLEENGQLVAYCRRKLRGGISYMGTDFKVYFDFQNRISRVEPIHEGNYPMTPPDSYGDLIVHLRKPDKHLEPVDPHLLRTFLAEYSDYAIRRIIIQSKKYHTVYIPELEEMYIQKGQFERK